MQGSLAEVNVSDLVVQIYTTKRSGILRLSQGDVKKSLYFKEGSIVFAHSNLKHERLGEILLRLGKITEAEFKSVAGKLAAGVRLGKALYEEGFLAPAEINAGVSYQIQMIVYSVFNWDHGDFEFVDRNRPVYEDIMVESSTPQLVIDGIRNINNLDVLQRFAGDLEDQPVVLSSGTQRLHRTNLDFSEETLLACVNGKASVMQLRSMSRLNPFEFGRALYCLSISGMIRIGGTDPIEKLSEAQDRSRQAGTPLRTQPMPSEKDARRKMKTFTEAELRNLILETTIRYKDATDEEVLNVFPDSLPEEIQQAYDHYTELFHPPYYATERYRDVKDDLKMIIDRINDAHRNLMERASVQQPLFEEDLAQQAMGASDFAAEKESEEPAPGVPQEPPAPFRHFSTADLQRELLYQPVNTILLRELGLRLQKEQKPAEGEKHLLRAVEIEPRNIENHFVLAEFYQSQGLRFKAFKHLNIILKLDPQNQRAMDALGIKKRHGGLYDIS